MKRKTFGLLLVSCLLVLLNITVAGAAELRFLSAGYPAVLLNYMIEKVAPEFERLYGVKVSIESAWDNRMDKSWFH